MAAYGNHSMTNERLPVTEIGHHTSTCRGNCRSGVALGVIVAVILSVWGWVLPKIGNAPTIRRSIDSTQRMGINPAAIFYTDVYETTKTPKPLWQQ